MNLSDIQEFVPYILTAVGAFEVGAICGAVFKKTKASLRELYEARSPAKNPYLFARIEKTADGEMYVHVNEIGCGTSSRGVNLFYDKERWNQSAFVSIERLENQLPELYLPEDLSRKERECRVLQAYREKFSGTKRQRSMGGIKKEYSLPLQPFPPKPLKSLPTLISHVLVQKEGEETAYD